MLLLDFHPETLSIWLIFMWCFIFPASKKMFLDIYWHITFGPTPLQMCLKKKKENSLTVYNILVLEIEAQISN